MNIFEHVGRYSILMKRTLTKPDKWKIFFRQYRLELEKLGVDSIGIVAIISVFIGAVIVTQTILNTENPILPKYTPGLVARDTILLEFSSSIIALILSGKIGSSIASEIGTMRITEQIDALDIMGVNSANYLILPKIAAMVTMIPCLVTISMFVGVGGGYLVAIGGLISANQYTLGIQYAFVPFYVAYSYVKSFFFAFIIVSVASYYGYYAYGGTLEVGKASTNAVVKSCAVVLFANVILTQLMLV